MNALAHTEHEPIRRVIMIEEVWPKKYNMSESSWARRYDEPKDPLSYYWQRAEMTAEGNVISAVPEYLTYLQTSSVADNPRLVNDLHRGRDHFVLSPVQRMASTGRQED